LLYGHFPALWRSPARAFGFAKSGSRNQNLNEPNMDATKRQVKIKTGVVKRCAFQFGSVVMQRTDLFAPSRLHKEYTMYQKEETSQREKIGKMKESNADAYDIKKQVRLLSQSGFCPFFRPFSIYRSTIVHSNS
jgi:hypothetical protein